MTTTLLLLLAAVLAVYLTVALRAFLKMRGQRVVICPETGAPAAVTVDSGHAALSAMWDAPDVRLDTCSRWPERDGCNQACAGQIEVSPEDTLAVSILKRWYAGRTCALCKRAISTVRTVEPRPGLLRVDAGASRFLNWDDIPAENLPAALESHLPVCADCTLAEAFRRQFPERVTDRADTELRDRVVH